VADDSPGTDRQDEKSDNCKTFEQVQQRNGERIRVELV